MTPIEDVFMLSIDAKLDYETLRKICLTGHSRVPVYEEVEVPASKLLVQVRKRHGSIWHWTLICSYQGATLNPADGTDRADGSAGAARTQKVKKIIGILLVKQVTAFAFPRSAFLAHPLRAVRLA